MTTSPSPRWDDPSLAACDSHLPDLLRKSFPEGSPARAARIVHLVNPDDRYSCSCGVPAHWYVRLFLRDDERPERGTGPDTTE